MKVLVLDDHKGFRDEVLHMLTHNGHEALGVEKAVDAIPLVESGEYDLVLVDFSMPEHDGIWFMRNVKKPRHTKALLVTAHVNSQVINHMFRVGASGYIIKPFGEEDLLRQLQHHSRGVTRHHAATVDSGNKSDAGTKHP
jgi:CheY-like chemotaxis protein